MAYWLYRNFNEFKNDAVNAEGLFVNKEINSSIDYILNSDKAKTDRNCNPKYLAHILHHKDIKRIKGGSQYHEEIYYDCQPFDQEEELSIENPLEQQQLLMNKEMENPKEFKRILKQTDYNHNILYRTFRQVHYKAKKSYKMSGKNYGLNSKYCRKCGDEINSQQVIEGRMDRGDINPLNVLHLEVPVKKCETLKNEKDKNNNEKYNYCECTSSCNSNTISQENVCSICCETSETSLQKPDNPATTGTKPENKLIEDPSCLIETNLCQQQQDELKDLNFCERCAVLRGEIPAPNKKQEVLYNTSQYDVVENISQAYQPSKCGCRPKSKKRKSNQPRKQTLDIKPITLTIPLKLQLDSQECKSRFIETEIILEASSGRQKQTTYFLQPPTTTIQGTSDSDVFRSCVSVSGIIEPPEDKLNNFSANSVPYKEKTLPQQIVEIKQQATKGTQSSTILPTILPLTSVGSTTAPLVAVPSPTAPLPIVPLSAVTLPAVPSSTELITTVYSPILTSSTLPVPTLPSTLESSTSIPSPTVPLTDAPKPINMDHIVTDPPKLGEKAQGAKSPTNLENLKMQAQGLPALEQQPPKATTQALQEETRFSLPNESRPNERNNVSFPCCSLPTNYLPMSSEETDKNKIRQKPPLHPKPVQRTVNESVQTDYSTLNAGGHYKRKDMRTEIQKELQELLKQNPSNTEHLYDNQERDEILLDLYKLFHPEKVGLLPEDLCREEVLDDIHFIVDTDLHAGTSTHSIHLAESHERVVEILKHIVNPKVLKMDEKKQKYTKEIREKILQYLQEVLTPHKQKSPANKEKRENILHDLRYMLDTGAEKSSTRRQHRSSQELQGPSTSHAQEIRQQQLQQRPSNEIRESLIADLRYMLDATPHLDDENEAAQGNAGQRTTSPGKPKRKPNKYSSEDSLLDNYRYQKRK